MAISALAFAALAALLWVAWKHELVTSWKREAGPIPFFAAMAVLPALGIPITPLFLLAGATFGTAAGLFGSGIALALNLALCHWIAVSRARPRIERLLRRYGYQLPDFRGTWRSALSFSLLVKLAPGLPAFAKNYLLGVSGVPLPIYFVVGMAITGAYGAAIVVLGESLLEHDLRPSSIAGGVLALTAAALAWWWRRSRPRTPAVSPCEPL